MRAQDNHESARQGQSRRGAKRLAAVAVTVAVAAGLVAFVVTQSSSAQTANEPAATPSSSVDAPSSQGGQPAAQSVSPVKEMSRAGYGAVLVTGSGATLYRYTPDKPDTPTCTGSCAVAWPPDLLPAGSTSIPAGGLTGLGSVRLSDGLRQVTYDKMPLYMFADDNGTSVNGQGIGGVWFVVHPSPTAHTATRSVAPTAPVPRSSSGGGYGY